MKNCPTWVGAFTSQKSATLQTAFPMTPLKGGRQMASRHIPTHIPDTYPGAYLWHIIRNIYPIHTQGHILPNTNAPRRKKNDAWVSLKQASRGVTRVLRDTGVAIPKVT